MSGFGSLRRGVLLGAIAVVAATAVAACSASNSPNPGTSTAPSSAGVGQVGQAPPTTTPATSPTSGGGGGGGGTTVRYPGNAKDYSTALLTAWSAKDHDRQVELAPDNVVQTLTDSPDYDSHWAYVSCTSDPTSVCTFYNNDGKGIQVGVSKAALGHPHAVTYVYLLPGEIPNTALGYANAFEGAWLGGDASYMSVLATSQAYNFFKGRSYADSGLTVAAGGTSNGRQTFTITTVGGSYNCQWVFTVDVNLANHRKLHAVDSAKVSTDYPCSIPS